MNCGAINWRIGQVIAFDPTYKGYFQIMQKDGDANCVIRKLNTMPCKKQECTAHIMQLRPLPKYLMHYAKLLLSEIIQIFPTRKIGHLPGNFHNGKTQTRNYRLSLNQSIRIMKTDQSMFINC